MQENWWHPGVGEASCFLSSSGSSQLVYFHIPVSRSARIFELNKFKWPSYCCRIYQNLLCMTIRSEHVQRIYYNCWKYQTAGDGPDVVQSGSLPAHCLLSRQVWWILKTLGRYEMNMNICMSLEKGEKVSDAMLHPRQKAETADVRRSRRYWFAFLILAIQSLLHLGVQS